VNAILSIPTIMVCTSITTLVVAMALTYVWFNDSREKANGWWCLAMWVATLATAILATRTTLPAWFSIGLGNMATSMAFGLVWAGFVAFSGGRPSYKVIAVGPLAWVVCYYGFEDFRNDINSRIIAISLIYGFYGVLIARRAWLGWKEEQLPSFLATIVFYGLHSFAYAARIPATIMYPAIEDHGLIFAPWFAVVAIEGFALTIFSTFVFMALIKERAERRYRLAAEIDSLTGVSSRRYFVSETRTTLARKPKAAVLVLLDLDHFKKINDSYGHMAGDRVLQAFANHVSSKIRPGMLFGRLGGEEFGLFLPDFSEEKASEFLDDVRAGVEALDIRFNGNTLKVTTSIGAVSVDEAGHDFDNLMAAADNALYVCKDEGRNRVSFFSSVMRLKKIVEGSEETRLSLSKNRISRIAVRSRAGQV
jgi:diguanylate cyclase (GGDEF)-like protein